MRLEQDELGPKDGLGGLPASARPLDEQGLHDVIREHPLHARLGVLEERLDEEPLALDVEADEALAGRVPGEPVGSVVDEVRGLDGRALERRRVEDEVRGVSRAMREVGQEPAAVSLREVADDERSTRPLLRHDGGGALDGGREARRREVSVVMTKEMVTRALLGHLDRVRQTPAVRQPYRALVPGVERRGGSTASNGEERERQRRESLQAHVEASFLVLR